MEITRYQAEMCGALSDYHRLLLLYAIAGTPKSVGELVQRIGLSQPAVSRHLRILRDSRIVTAERRGKSMYYFVTDERIIQSMDLLRTMLAEQMQKQGVAAGSALQRPPV